MSILRTPRFFFFLLLLLVGISERCSSAILSEEDGVSSEVDFEDAQALRPYDRALRQLEEDELEVETRRLKKKKGKKGKGASLNVVFR